MTTNIIILCIGIVLGFVICGFGEENIGPLIKRIWTKIRGGDK